VSSNRCRAATATRTLHAASITSTPTPSPGITAIRNDFIGRPRLLCGPEATGGISAPCQTSPVERLAARCHYFLTIRIMTNTRRFLLDEIPVPETELLTHQRAYGARTKRTFTVRTFQYPRSTSTSFNRASPFMALRMFPAIFLTASIGIEVPATCGVIKILG